MTEVQTLKAALSEMDTNSLSWLTLHAPDTARRRGAKYKHLRRSVSLQGGLGEPSRQLNEVKPRPSTLGAAQRSLLVRRTRKAVKNLQRQCQTLNSLVALDALAICTHKVVMEARKEQRGWQVVKENKAILDRYYFPS